MRGLYIKLHCHHRHDSVTDDKICSDVSHLNVSFIPRGGSSGVGGGGGGEGGNKVVLTNHNFCRQRTAEADSNRHPSAYQPIMPYRSAKLAHNSTVTETFCTS